METDVITKHVLIKVTLSCQRHCRGTDVVIRYNKTFNINYFSLNRCFFYLFRTALVAATEVDYTMPLLAVSAKYRTHTEHSVLSRGSRCLERRNRIAAAVERRLDTHTACCWLVISLAARDRPPSALSDRLFGHGHTRVSTWCLGWYNLELNGRRDGRMQISRSILHVPH